MKDNGLKGEMTIKGSPGVEKKARLGSKLKEKWLCRPVVMLLSRLL